VQENKILEKLSIGLCWLAKFCEVPWPSAFSFSYLDLRFYRVFLLSAVRQA